MTVEEKEETFCWRWKNTSVTCCCFENQGAEPESNNFFPVNTIPVEFVSRGKECREKLKQVAGNL